MANQKNTGGSQRITHPTLVKTVSASRDLEESDIGCILECTGTITINAPSIFKRPFQVVLVNVGLGTIAISADGTLRSKAGADTITEQYAAATLYSRQPDDWVLLGDIA